MRQVAALIFLAVGLLPDGNGGTTPFTYAYLVALTLDALNDPETWPQLATFLDKLDTAPSSRAAAAALDELRTELGISEEDSEDSEDSEGFSEGLPGVLCSDTDNPATVEAWSRAAVRADPAAPYFGRLFTWISSICQPWPGKDADRYTGPFTARTVHPVLVIGTRFDPATPYQGAVTVSRLLPRSRLLTLEGWGHIALYQSSCVDRHLSRYLLTTQPPPRGAVCKPDVVPFARPNAVSDVGDEAAA